ncbi:MAG: antibiotic biosynthesis monooxygenase [Gammaproteobacteria bacterium]|jgi:heme-degrading monooxygenase HmoA|nr:antibiotic biosynthesis monooxygenase [Gammaproteobacteria bacterium]
MIIERAELPITPGQESDFEGQFAIAAPYLREARGCARVSLARGVESSSKYLLLIEWESIEAHHAFTLSEGFDRFRDLVARFFAGKPDTEHFAPLNTVQVSGHPGCRSV